MLAKGARTAAKHAKAFFLNLGYTLLPILGDLGSRPGALGEHLVRQVPEQGRFTWLFVKN
jgi:hypothetical protein